MNNNATSNLILKTFDLFDAEHPPEVATMLERHETIRATQASTETGGLLAAITEALAAGKNPATDKAVAQALIAERVAEMSYAVSVTIDEEMRHALTANTAAIVDAWRPAFDTLAATLTDCYRALDGLDLSDQTAVLRLAGDAAEWWTTAKATLARLT